MTNNSMNAYLKSLKNKKIKSSLVLSLSPKTSIFQWLLFISSLIVMCVMSVPIYAQNQVANTVEDQKSPLYHVEVLVTDVDKKPIEDKVVFLRAARVKGPFEPKAPPAQHEWTSITDEHGIARFEVEPSKADGLRLQAVMSLDDRPYESVTAIPEDQLKLAIETYGTTQSLDGITIQNIRMVVQVWEGFLTFTQFYTITNRGKEAIDLGDLPGEDFEKGLPIRLPVKAKGISATGTGQTQIVQSTVFWDYYLKPNEIANLQLQYSMSETGHSFIYEQMADYPINNIEIVVPIQTEYHKVPRLDHVALYAPEFKHVAATDEERSPIGLRSDYDFIAAWGREVKPGETFLFRLTGLPFKESPLPWVVLVTAIMLSLLLVVRGVWFSVSKESISDELRVEFLEKQRENYLNEIASLEESMKLNQIDAGIYKVRKKKLYQRLALLMRKLDEEPS